MYRYLPELQSVKQNPVISSIYPEQLHDNLSLDLVNPFYKQI